MLFLDKSTRTRNAFESGMTQLGGHAIFLDAEKTQVAHGESPKDMGIILSALRRTASRSATTSRRTRATRGCARSPRWADIPLINLQCDVDHPTQTLADLMTLREHARRGPARAAASRSRGPTRRRTRKPLSVPQGLAMLLPRFGMDVVLAHPPGFELMPEVLEKAAGRAAEGGGSITFVDDMDEAFAGADVVYPKSWGRLDAFSDEATALAESAQYSDWICDARRMALAKPDALYMHCLPADRGTEVTDEVIDGPQSVVYGGREPHAHRQGAHGPDDGWLRLTLRTARVRRPGAGALAKRRRPPAGSAPNEPLA